MAEPLLDLGKTNLAREAQIFAVRAILSGCKLGHGRDSLPAGITGEDSISLHTPMVTRRKIRVNLGRGARLIHSGCGAAWLARLLGVQEVPGSNPGSPTNKTTHIHRRSAYKLAFCDITCDITLLDCIRGWL